MGSFRLVCSGVLRCFILWTIKGTTRMAHLSLEYFERYVGPWFSSLLGPYKGIPLATGRLSQVIEGNGKRRLFAICNYVKQRLLFPVHVWAMSVLSSIKQDGTFNQEQPLYLLRSKRCNNCYSFDLKSATDRWPLSVIYTLMSCIWGSTLASSIVNSSLGLNTFLVMPPITKRLYEVAFVTGQPLGYYGSWSLFSLSHHYIVWLAAKKAYPDRTSPFSDYALLGDDILITDSKVADQYKMLLDRLGVSISLPKSIISATGGVEFAKRFWVKSMQVDLSPISLKALTFCRTTMGLCSLANKYDISMSNLQRLGGAGFRVRARLLSTQSKRWERLKAARIKPGRSGSLPLDFWIGRFGTLNPYLKGKIVALLLKELKPKELCIFPEDAVFDGEREILERTTLLNWVKQWLRWLSWYHTIQLRENVTIEELMDAPICAKSWKRSNEDINFFKFGLIFKCYDMGAGWDISTTPRWLLDPNTSIQFDRWILGGYKGTDFLMAPVDLPSLVKGYRL
nr:hypothetical protein [Solanum melongena]WMB97167.1 hypothetical protein [Solanum aethiopicum]